MLVALPLRVLITMKVPKLAFFSLLTTKRQVHEVVVDLETYMLCIYQCQY